MPIRDGHFLLLEFLASRAAADPLPDKQVVAAWNREWFFAEYLEDNFRDVPRLAAAV